MKVSQLFLVAVVLVIASSIFIWSGCEYDVAEPQWDKPYTEPPQTTITGIEPAAAVAGVNIITIHGQNFNGVSITQGVLFNTVFAEVVENTGTILRVRRPNLAAEEATVKIISTSLVEAKMSPYKIDPVSVQYGSFVDNVELAVVGIDANENLYVVETSTRTIHKVTPGGEKTTFASASRTPTDATFGPDGNLYLLSNSANNRYIERVDIVTGEVTDWTRLPQGRGIAKYGAFDDVNLYAGSTGSRGLFIVPFGNPENVSSSGFYEGEEILAVRIFASHLYVASRTSSSQPAKIWKHQLQAGTLGAQELVFDMSNADSVFSSGLINAISISSDGNIFLGIDNPNPLLIIDPSTQEVDYFYKGIVPPYCKHFSWGNENYIYMISGNDNPAQEWTVYRVDMGTQAAQ